MKDRTADSERQPATEAKPTAVWQRAFEREYGAFRGAFEHAAIGMALVGLEGRFLKVNRSLCRIVGYSEEELLATDFQCITYPDDLQADLTLANQLWRGEIDHYHMEKRYLHKQGHQIWILLSASAVRDETGQPCYGVAQIQDITARKTAELDSARRLQQMERLTRTASQVLQTLESTADDSVYPAVLRTILDAFESRAGLFLRLSDHDVLIESYLHEDGSDNVRCYPKDRDDLWDAALSTGTVVVENKPRPIGCGRIVACSLVAPILHNSVPVGLFHLGDGQTDYDLDDRDLLSRVAKIIAPVLYARMERDKLTPREEEVMDLIVSAKTQKQIASELGISVQTIAKHRAKVLEKLQVCNDVELVHLALRMRTPSA